MKNEKTTITFSPQLRKRIDAWVQQTGNSMAEFFRRCAEKELDDYEAKRRDLQPPSKKRK